MGNLDINWKLFGAYLAGWILTACALSKGTKIVGYVSYVTATAPYLIMVALFAYAVSLPGAKEGMDFYLLKPNLAKIYDFNVSVLYSSFKQFF